MINARRKTVLQLLSKSSKYKNVATIRDGIRFSSGAESRRYDYLRIRQRIGEIADLELQPRFPVVVEGKKICTYVADFRYMEISSGRTIIEDVKGVRTPVYKLKKKLVEAIYRVEIIEC